MPRKIGCLRMDDSERTREEIFTAMGRCLHAWGFVELEIANLYMILQGIRRDAYTHPMRAAFEAVIALPVRLAMIGAYVEADRTLADYLPHVQPLKTKIRKQYEKRHEIAHALVGREMTPNGLRASLRPFVTMYGHSQKRGTQLSLDQINDRTKAFNALADRIRRHVQSVGAMRGLPAEFYASPGEIAFPPLGPDDLVAHDK